MKSQYETSSKEQQFQLGIILSTVVLTFVHYQYGTATSPAKLISEKSKTAQQIHTQVEPAPAKSPLVDRSLANPGILSPTALRSARLNGKSKKFQ